MPSIVFKGQVFRKVSITRNEQLWARVAKGSKALSDVAAREGIDDYYKKQQAQPVANELRGVLRDLMVW